VFSAEVGEPRPGEETFHGDHEPLVIGGHCLEEWFWGRFHVAVEQKFALVAHDAEVHTPGMQVNPAIKLMLSVVKSHEVSPFIGNLVSHCQHTTVVC
jgi:hypothetical protein